MAYDKISNIILDKAKNIDPNLFLIYPALEPNQLLESDIIMRRDQFVDIAKGVYGNNANAFKQMGTVMRGDKDYVPFTDGKIKIMPKAKWTPPEPGKSTMATFEKMSYGSFKLHTFFMVTGVEEIYLDSQFNYREFILKGLNKNQVGELARHFGEQVQNLRHDRIVQLWNNGTINPNYTVDISATEVTFNSLLKAIRTRTGISGRRDPSVLAMSPATFDMVEDKISKGTIKERIIAVNESSDEPKTAYKFAHPLFVGNIKVYVIEGLVDNHFFFGWPNSIISLDRPMDSQFRYAITVEELSGNTAGTIKVSCRHSEMLQIAGSNYLWRDKQNYPQIADYEISGGATIEEMKTLTAQKKKGYDPVYDKATKRFLANSGLLIAKIKK